jgi:hypothetical protein
METRQRGCYKISNRNGVLEQWSAGVMGELVLNKGKERRRFK